MARRERGPTLLAIVPLQSRESPNPPSSRCARPRPGRCNAPPEHGPQTESGTCELNADQLTDLKAASSDQHSPRRQIQHAPADWARRPARRSVADKSPVAAMRGWSRLCGTGTTSDLRGLARGCGEGLLAGRPRAHFGQLETDRGAMSQAFHEGRGQPTGGRGCARSWRHAHRLAWYSGESWSPIASIVASHRRALMWSPRAAPASAQLRVFATAAAWITSGGGRRAVLRAGSHLSTPAPETGTADGRHR